jgi:hypothetical protein
VGTIMVQMADPQWTEQALHLACSLAWQHKARIVLLRLESVSYPGWLGTELGEPVPTEQETGALQAYAAIAKDYGVDFTVQPMQYITLEGALVDAANLIDAQVVFAQPSKSVIPYWDKLRLWSLERRLAAHKRHLYTLNQPIDTTDWILSMTAKVGK